MIYYFPTILIICIATGYGSKIFCFLLREINMFMTAQTVTSLCNHRFLIEKSCYLPKADINYSIDWKLICLMVLNLYAVSKIRDLTPKFSEKISWRVFENEERVWLGHHLITFCTTACVKAGAQQAGDGWADDPIAGRPICWPHQPWSPYLSICLSNISFPVISWSIPMT